MPILGLQSSSRNILSEGTVIYPESQLGVWSIAARPIPSEASLVVARSPGYGGPELLDNPGFDFGFHAWRLGTPADKRPMLVNILSGYVGNSAVMFSDELGYKGGLIQNFDDVPPNTIFHFKAMVKTVDAEALEANVAFWSIYVGGKWSEGGSWGRIHGSHAWTLYEVSFTTPNVTTAVNVAPALVYNKGEVWIDEASLTIEGWQPPPQTPAILDWYALHPPSPFVTEADIEYVEYGLKTVPTENFWGIIGPVTEEHYRIHVEFNDDVNTTYFGENLLGYPLYLTENPGATMNQWKDEMFLRMVRGFYNYFSPLTKVGITVAGAAIVVDWKNQSWCQGISKYYGDPAMVFIREHYDFVVLYAYTENLEQFTNWTSQYFQLIDQLFQKQKKIWVLTRIFNYNRLRWQPEAMALEIEGCLDRNMVITLYSSNDPPFEEIWPLMLKEQELYDTG